MYREFEPSLPGHQGHQAIVAPWSADQLLAESDDISCEPPRVNILVVEDSAADFALIERCLTHMPRYEAQITLAGSLAAARLAAGADRFDAILVDYSLGDEIGVDLVRELASRGGVRPCILVTGMLTDEVESEALQAGAVACIAKDDLTPRLIDTVLHKVIESKGTVGGAETNPTETEFEPADGDCIDAQSVVVEAIRIAREQRGGGHRNRARVQLQLQDRPVYVRADREGLLRTLDRAIQTFGSRPVLVAVQPAGEFNEILIEPGMVSRTGSDREPTQTQAPAAGTRSCDSHAAETEAVLRSLSRQLQVKPRPSTTQGPGLTVVLPSACRTAG